MKSLANPHIYILRSRKRTICEWTLSVAPFHANTLTVRRNINQRLLTTKLRYIHSHLSKQRRNSNKLFDFIFDIYISPRMCILITTRAILWYGIFWSLGEVMNISVNIRALLLRGLCLKKFSYLYLSWQFISIEINKNIARLVYHAFVIDSLSHRGAIKHRWSWPLLL